MQEKKSNSHFTIPSLFHLVNKTRVHIHVTGAIKALSNKKVDSYFQVLTPEYYRESGVLRILCLFLCRHLQLRCTPIMKLSCTLSCDFADETYDLYVDTFRRTFFFEVA